MGRGLELLSDCYRSIKRTMLSNLLRSHSPLSFVFVVSPLCCRHQRICVIDVLKCCFRVWLGRGLQTQMTEMPDSVRWTTSSVCGLRPPTPGVSHLEGPPNVSSTTPHTVQVSGWPERHHAHNVLQAAADPLLSIPSRQQ